MGWRKQSRAHVGVGETAMVESSREVCGSVRVVVRKPKMRGGTIR